MEYICTDCPRACGAKRGDDTPGGFCMSGAMPHIVRAAPHYGEEPCISGTRGSGAIFFSGCNLRCIFCQNHEISRACVGRGVSVDGLRDIMRRLRDEGVHNINLVTPTHYVRAIAAALDGLELGIPVVWNSSGYESVDSLRRLEGLVQVYMPDMKYTSAALARRYSAAEDYFPVAAAAIFEMLRQRGEYVLDGEGLLRSGVLIRHLILPGAEENTRGVIDFVADNFAEGEVLFSLMSQYTPMPGAARCPELARRVSAQENARMIAYMEQRGICEGYWQDVDAATEEMIPEFDGTGV